MKTFIITDWAWTNCIVDNAPNGMLPWGYVVTEEKERVKINRTLSGEVVRESEKAINVKVNVVGFDSRMNMTKTYDWFFWVPKKCIVENNGSMFFDGGESMQAEMWAIKIADGRKVLGAWWD